MLDLAPEVESAVRERAAREGLTASDYIARLLRAAEPEPSRDPVERVRGLLARWQNEDGTPLLPSVPSAELFRRWAEEDAALPTEERAAREMLWREFREGRSQGPGHERPGLG